MRSPPQWLMLMLNALKNSALRLVEQELFDNLEQVRQQAEV